MSMVEKKMKNLCRVTGISILLVFSGSGCSENTSVSVHGVNYTEQTFFYSILKGDDLDASVGETIEPYGAGGTVCCYSLPHKWRPDLTVRVRTTVSSKGSDGNLFETTKIEDVRVAPYSSGSPGELWILRDPGGNVSAISSDYQPNHPKWPGKIKGWPTPSLNYQQERWKIYMDHELEYVTLAKEFLAELETDPDGLARRKWRIAMRDEPSEYTRFQGPDDPKFRAFLKSRYEAMLQRSERNVEKLQEAKP